MSALKSVSNFFVEALTPSWMKKRMAQARVLTEDQRWALVAAAQLTALNQDSHETLDPDPAKDSADWGMALGSWWEVFDRAGLLEQLAALKQSGHRVELRDVLGHDVLAWDYARLINVARWGYGARYLQEDEAWSHILEAAGQLRSRYSSWTDLAHDYVLGHDAWAGGPDASLEQATAKLLDPDNKKSPWNQVGWASFSRS